MFDASFCSRSNPTIEKLPRRTCLLQNQAGRQTMMMNLTRGLLLPLLLLGLLTAPACSKRLERPPADNQNGDARAKDPANVDNAEPTAARDVAELQKSVDKVKA